MWRDRPLEIAFGCVQHRRQLIGLQFIGTEDTEYMRIAAHYFLKVEGECFYTTGIVSVMSSGYGYRVVMDIWQVEVLAQSSPIGMGIAAHTAIALRTLLQNLRHWMPILIE